MPKLYVMPGTCALAPNIAIAWTDAPIEVVAMKYGDHKKQNYLAINPKGQVPALQFDDGDVLTEAAAILSYIGTVYGDPAFTRDTELGRKEAEALSYLTSAVHADFGPHFAPTKFIDGKDEQKALKAKTYETLGQHYSRLNDQIGSSGDWYLAKRSFADAYLYVVERWIEQTPQKLSDYPHLQAHHRRMEQDDGVQLALQRQNMELQA